MLKPPQLILVVPPDEGKPTSGSRWPRARKLNFSDPGIPEDVSIYRYFARLHRAPNVKTFPLCRECHVLHRVPNVKTTTAVQVMHRFT